MGYLVLSFYKIIQVDAPEQLVSAHQKFFSSSTMTGRIYISTQGINAQVSGRQMEVAHYLQWLRSDPRFADVMTKAQAYHENVFPRMTVKVRPELVALGRPVDLSRRGASVSPQRWRNMLGQEEAYLRLDVRNGYEWDLGHFEGFERPPCDTFRDFSQQAEQLVEKMPLCTPIMMCCTGGIRCEFYSALLLEMGFEKVYQLEGGILRYCAEQRGVHWKGKLFVFDDRLAVDVEGQEITGRCHRCAAPADIYYNCANMDCNALFISCADCLELLQGCCQERCRSSIRLRPFDQQRGGKPFRKWYVYFNRKDAAVCA
jgi:UPF0176 protein